MMPDADSVEYDIILKAAQALTELQKLNTQATSFNQKVANTTATLKAFSAQTGLSMKATVSLFKDADQAFAALNNKSALFGDLQKQGWQEVEKGSGRAVRGIDAARIALGAIVAMLVFNAIAAVQNFFREAINQARQFEETLYRLRNVEETLSMQGIEVSMQGLKKGIQDIQKLLPIFSKEDVSQLVGTLAISTKQLGLNEEQILDLAKAIGILNIRSEKQEDISTTAQHVLSSLLTGNAKGITALGIAFTDNVMRAKAMELGFLDAGEAVANLTENEKGLTKLNIILESTANETANISEYLDTNSARLQENSAAWKDLQTTVGQVILPFIPAMTEFFSIIRDGFNFGKVIIIEFMTLLAALGTTMALVFTGNIKDIETFTDVLQGSINKFRETLVNQFFQEMPEDAPEWFKRGWGDLIQQEAETATSGIEEFGEAVESVDFSEFEQKIEDILSDAADAREDLAENMSRKLEDLDEEYHRKAIDAERDFNRKIEDINRDAERDLAELREEHRQEDERAEEEYQLRLWELRQRFLMDLDDALHARDARQILRLQRQYAIDKEAAARRHALENDEREQSQEDEAEDISRRRREQIENARIEYQQKLADLNIAKQREMSDLQTWYDRELSDLQTNMERKAQALIDAGIREGEITEANAATVYGILREYFGPGGLTDELYQYMTNSLMAQAQNAINIANSMLGSLGSRDMSSPIPVLNAPSTPTNLINQGVPPSVANGLGFAEGGTLLATRPTKAIFGEGGPELVNFTPLNRIGKNINKIFGGGTGGAGMDGQIRIMVDLSSDLEGRIVEHSMNSVAEVITRVQRAK